MNEESIFCEALQKPTPEARTAFLDAACAGDASLRRAVDGLLLAHARAGAFLADSHARRGATADDLIRERPGMAIGPYKLLEQIGEGGFGVVFIAEQTQPIRRKVALKILKPGMDTKQVIARFEAERQALALMDHPHIAHVFDGGETASGRPYFVMELVKGTPITQYCDEQRLTPRQRLELLVPVCQAIQHAHQKGIIHRDLKPSNVLVAPYDGQPVVKVIDFGVAKATGQRLTDRTLFTGFGTVVGTLEYMSPEQAVLNDQDIDTRSDVYSLGVLLYELLTGTTPLERKRAQDAGLVEALRIIREEETPRPSARLSTLAELPRIAADRGLEPKKLSGLVRGELDWIVMKALEKERARRYESAGSLAKDIERYLADESVQACPPSAWYRGRKFTWRHRTGLAVAGLILLFIVLVGGGVAWALGDRAARQARAANELELALDRAELFLGQGKRPEALAALDRAELLVGQVPADPAQDARLAALKERLAAEARDQQFSDRFEEIRLRVQGGVDVKQSLFTAGAAYPQIRDALQQYGIAIGTTAPADAAVRIQGRSEPVCRNLVAALDECLRLAPKEDVQARQWLLAALAVADTDAKRWRARQAASSKDWKTLEQWAREADVGKQPPNFLTLMATALPEHMKPTRLELLRRTQRAHPADLWANHSLAWELVHHGQPAEAVRYYTAALALRPDSSGIYLNRGNALREAGEVDAAIADYHQSFALAPEYAEPHKNLGDALQDRGQLDDAIAAYREAIRLKKDLPQAHIGLGNALKAKGRLDDAIAAYRQAVRIKEDYAEAHTNLAMALHDKGQFDDAIAASRQAILIDKDLLQAHHNLGNALKAKGRLDEAIAAYREAIRIKEESAPAHNGLGTALHDKDQLDEAIAEYRGAIRLKQDYPQAHYNLGNALQAKGQLDEAIAEYREAIRLKKDFPQARNNLGNALLAKGLVDEAIADFREAIRLKENLPEAHYSLGNALYRKRQMDDAIAAYREAIRLKQDYAEAHCYLGNALYEKGQMDDAIATYREAIRLKKDYAEAHCNLGAALIAKGLVDEAIAEYREGIRLKENIPEAHYSLGNALSRKGKLDEAIAAYREAIRLKKDYAEAYCNLGGALLARSLVDEAIAEYRKAIRLKQNIPEAHFSLGDALFRKGQLDDAIAAYREAIRLKKNNAEAHCNLGHALRQQGKFREALDALRRGHQLGSKDPRWPYPSAEWVHQCERLVELDGQLPGFLEGKTQPASPAARVELAWLCSLKRLHRAAARFYEEAFAAQPSLAEGLGTGHRYNAACAAALAGCGQGRDAAPLDEPQRARLRRQALDWLRADLTATKQLLDKQPEQARAAVQRTLQQWQQDADFAGVRGAALAKLPEAERQPWQQLWTEVDQTLMKLSHKGTKDKTEERPN